MGEVDDCAFFERFAVVDDDIHTFVGILSCHFDLRSEGQLTMGRRQGVLLKNLSTGGLVPIKPRA